MLSVFRHYLELLIFNCKEDAGQLRRNKQATVVHLKVLVAFVQQLCLLGPFSSRQWMKCPSV